MSGDWVKTPLRELAQIRVSNVDKKAHPAEQQVRLCNYLDVYLNPYISGDLEFMQASASIGEIERFALRRGDVIITKDSETPDDIGIPAVITEDVPSLVCGYHLALIRPKPEAVNSVYLAKQLATPETARYFAIRATGSTRYGLSIASIECVPIPTPPKPEQDKIADILSKVDAAIRQTEALIAKQERVETGLLQTLLSRGIDNNGNLRSERTHEFKPSPLGPIPKEWDTNTISELATRITDGDHHTPRRSEAGYYLLSARNVCDGFLDLVDVDYVPASEYQRMRRRCDPDPGDILISCSGTIGRICEVPPNLECVLVRSAALVKPRHDLLSSRFAEWMMRSPIVQRQIFAAQRQGAQPNLFQSEIASLRLLRPPREEQETLAAILDSRRADTIRLQESLAKLQRLKKGVARDLLTGRRRVTALLKKADVALQQVS